MSAQLVEQLLFLCNRLHQTTSLFNRIILVAGASIVQFRHRCLTVEPSPNMTILANESIRCKQEANVINSGLLPCVLGSSE